MSCLVEGVHEAWDAVGGDVHGAGDAQRGGPGVAGDDGGYDAEALESGDGGGR